MEIWRFQKGWQGINLEKHERHAYYLENRSDESRLRTEDLIGQAAELTTSVTVSQRC